MRSSMLLDSLWVLVTRLGNRASNFLIFLLLARTLPVAEFGIYGYVVSTGLVLSVLCDLGLRQSAAYFVGQGQEDQKAVATHLAMMWLLLGTVAAVSGWVALWWGGYAETDRLIPVLAALATACMLLIRMGQGMFLGLGQIKNLNQSEVVSRVVMLSTTLALWALGRLTLEASLWILLFAHLIAGAWLCFQLRDRFAPSTLVRWSLLRGMLGHGLVFAGGIMMMILTGRVGIWIVNALLDPDAVGVYFGLVRLAEMVVEVATAVGVVIFSHGVRATDAKAAASEAIRVARLVMSVMAVVALIAGLAAEPLIGVLVGGAFSDHTLGFRIMLVGAVASCLTMMLYPNLSSKGNAKWGVAIFAPGLLVASVLGWIFTGLWGIDGACLAVSIANIVIAIALTIVYRHLFGFSPWALVVPQRADFVAIGAQVRRLPQRLRGLLRRLPGLNRLNRAATSPSKAG